MDRKMWMGPRGRERWVPAPAIGGDWSAVGWNSKTQYIGGGASVRNSFTTHNEYNMSWNLNSRTELIPIKSMYQGTYGTGLIYFTDPMVADLNLLNSGWANPSLACEDGIPLIGDVRPTRIPQPNALYDYPANAAQYTLVGVGRSTYLPIPPGYVAWVGVHGSVNGTGGVCVTPITRAGGTGTNVYPDMLSNTTTERVNTSFDGDTYGGIELSLRKSGTATTVILYGMIVQMLPQGVEPLSGDFIAGQGNSGCMFESAPSQTAYSAALDKIGMSAKLVEVGDWQ